MNFKNLSSTTRVALKAFNDKIKDARALVGAGAPAAAVAAVAVARGGAGRSRTKAAAGVAHAGSAGGKPAGKPGKLKLR